jgi:uncharacterized protein YbaP (TraB family)
MHLRRAFAQYAAAIVSALAAMIAPAADVALPAASPDGMILGDARAETSARVATAAPRAPEAPDPRGLLFLVEKAGVAPSYVFGTLHSSDPRVTALPEPVARAFDGARSFATESRLTLGEIAGFFEAAQFDDGRRLADFFDAATVAEIRARLGARAPRDATLERLKPWAVMLLLSEAPAAAASGEPTLDERLLADARARRLAIVGLELPDEQVAAFDAISPASQVALVRHLLAHRDALEGEHEAVVEAWLARDLVALAALEALQRRRHPDMAPHLAELARHLVENRSVQMAHRLFLPLRGGRVFVAVGALHLAGERSLLALLREQGYRIRPVY